jgi:hypothetical protein
MPATDAPLSDDDASEMARESRSNTPANRLAEVEVIAWIRWLESMGQTFTPLVPPSLATAEAESDDDDKE